MAHCVVWSYYRGTRGDLARGRFGARPRAARSRRWFVARATARRAAAGEISVLCSAAYDCSSPRLGRSTPRTNRAMAQGRFRPCSGGARRALAALNGAISGGLRGLPGGSTLTQLLIEHRGIRSKCYAPRLVIPQILAWADAFHARNGQWPLQCSGPRHRGTRRDLACDRMPPFRLASEGCPAGRACLDCSRGSAAQRSGKDPRPITIPEILQWADAYKERHGRWPDAASGPVPEAPAESWKIITRDLRSGRRGLPARSSIARLLAEHRGRRSVRHLADLTVPQILAWIHEFHARTGRWPTDRSGAIPDSSGETWRSRRSRPQKGPPRPQVRSVPRSPARPGHW